MDLTVIAAITRLFKPQPNYLVHELFKTVSNINFEKKLQNFSMCTYIELKLRRQSVAFKDII